MRRAPLPPLLIAAAAALAFPGPAAAQSGSGERVQLEQRLDRVRASLGAAEDRAGSIDAQLDDLDLDEAGLRDRIVETAGRMAVVEQRIAADETSLVVLGGQQNALRKRLQARRADVARVLAALQRIGRRPPPALALEGDGPLTAVRSAIALNAVLPSLTGEAAELARTLQEAKSLAAAEERTYRALLTELETLRSEQARLDGLQAALERRRAIQTFERGRAEAQLQRLSEEARSVEALIEGAAGVANAPASPPPGRFDLARGRLTAPVAGRFVARYGEPTATGALTKGDTIAALPEAVVIAPVDATVLFAAPFRSFDTVLILDVGGGYHLVLSGMTDSFVDVGSEVAAGEAVGRMGTTPSRAALLAAGATGAQRIGARPALYVELRKEGAAIDSHGWWREGVAEVEGTTG